MSGLLNALPISDVPEIKAEPIKANGVIGSVETKEIKNGYVSVTVPITFDGPDGNERTFTARFNVRPEWFEADYKPPVGAERGTPEYSEAISYQINLQKLTRGLFKAVGHDTLDFGNLEGERVGFSAGPRKDDPERLDIKSFYAPK